MLCVVSSEKKKIEIHDFDSSLSVALALPLSQGGIFNDLCGVQVTRNSLSSCRGEKSKHRTYGLKICRAVKCLWRMCQSVTAFT